MNCLVTGGAGFIGSHLVDELLEQGDRVVVIDNLYSGNIENLFRPFYPRDLELCKEDIRDKEKLDKIFKDGNFDIVYHLAAIPRVQHSIKEPTLTHEVNVNGTLNLLESCRKHGVRRFVFSSSSSVYGNQDELPLRENMKPNPMSPYAMHKLMGEQYGKLWKDLYEIEPVFLRYFNVYGPRQNPSGEYACLIAKFTKMLLEGKRPTIFGDGTHTRDYTYVKDVVRANLLASNLENRVCVGEAFNIGAGDNRSVLQVYERIRDISGKDIMPQHLPEVIEPKDTLADISKAERLLDWTPKVSFADGLQKTYEYFAKH